MIRDEDNQMEPPQGAIPLAPFFKMMFGEMNSEDEVAAAASFIASNPDKIQEAFQSYINSNAHKDLLSLMGEGESG